MAYQNTVLKNKKWSCTICYTSKMTTFSKLTTVYASNFQLGELINMDFGFYNVTSTCGFISILTVIFANTIMIWVFPAASKLSHVLIIHFILTTLKNKQHPCKFVRVDENGALENSTYVTNLIVE